MNYERIYHDIVKKAKLSGRKKLKKDDPNYVYYEAHHIIPVCLGGKGKKSQINHENIVLLTAREHYLCHKLLCEIYKDNKSIIYAFWAMSNVWNGSNNRRYIPNSKDYELARKLYVELISGDKNPMRRAELSGENHHTKREEVRAKMSKSNKGKINSKETREKIGLANKGKLVTQETRKKMSISKSGVRNNRYGKSAHNAKNMLHLEYGIYYESVYQVKTLFQISYAAVYNLVKSGVLAYT
jgi:hypothetical protein